MTKKVNKEIVVCWTTNYVIVWREVVGGYGTYYKIKVKP